MRGNDIRELENIYYDILNENRHLLEEMFVVGSNNGKFFVVALKDKIWKISKNVNDSDEDVKKSFVNTFNVDLSQFDDIYHVFFYIKNNQPNNNEILFGEFNKGTLIVYDEFYHMLKNPYDSVILKKTTHTLKPSKVKFRSGKYETMDLQNRAYRTENTKIFYHGTSSEKLKSIIRTGIDGKIGNSNYKEEIKQIIKGNVFITSNFRYAFDHALRNAKMDKSKPVVISFRVRFEDLLQPDYDVLKHQPDKLKALKISREVGVYGYKGVILPTDFREIFYVDEIRPHVDEYSKDDIKSISGTHAYQDLVLRGLELGEHHYGT